jgi:hypothetical protein
MLSLRVASREDSPQGCPLVASLAVAAECDAGGPAELLLDSVFTCCKITVTDRSLTADVSGAAYLYSGRERGAAR